MSLFGRKEKDEIARLKAQMSPEQLQAADYDRILDDLEDQIDDAQATLKRLQRKCSDANAELQSLKEELIETDEAILLQEFGFYTPHYQYSVSDEYKEKIKQIRSLQKEMVKNGYAVSGNQKWQVNGSASEGKKMVRDTQKLLLRAFNTECDDAVEHVRFNNIEASEKKIHASATAISNLGKIMSISISPKYESLKIKELRLVFEYQRKKQEEKEAAKELRERQREETKVAKELADARAKLEKEQAHYQNAIDRLHQQMAHSEGAALNNLKAKEAELLAQLGKINTEIEDVDYRAANQRAGYVYVISNIGAFGEDVYKIGMTRRLDPMERVNELGDASVPFNFDVHAMIFTDDAPGLEAALHNAFADRKVNFVNQRREFFYVTLDEIKRVIRENYDKTVEFTDVAPAEQYRETLRLRSSNGG